LKIIIDARWIKSQEVDGIGSFTLNIIKELLNLDFKNEYILLLSSESIKNFIQTYIKKDISNISYILDCSVNSIKNIYKLPKILFETKSDLYFSPNYSFFNLFVFNCKKISVVHDLIPLIFFEMFQNASIKFKFFYCNKHLQRFVLNSLDKIITVSESSKKDLLSYLHIEESKIKVILEGTTSFNINQNLDDYLKSINITPHKYFLFVGRHEKYKNISTLIEVYNLLPEKIKEEYKLVIIGKFNENVTPNLENIVKKYNLEKNIIFFDSIIPDKLHCFYKNAKILIHLSLYEGFGLTILESMSYGIPIIASNVSSIPEVVENAGLLVDPSNNNQIIDSIIQLVNDENLYKELSNKSIERAKFFSWEKTAKQLLEIFEDANRKNIN